MQATTPDKIASKFTVSTRNTNPFFDNGGWMMAGDRGSGDSGSGGSGDSGSGGGGGGNGFVEKGNGLEENFFTWEFVSRNCWTWYSSRLRIDIISNRIQYYILSCITRL